MVALQKKKKNTKMKSLNCCVDRKGKKIGKATLTGAVYGTLARNGSSMQRGEQVKKRA
jgi:hypothetical protein